VYREVSRNAYTKKDLGRTYRDSDLPRFGITKSSFDSIAGTTAEEFASDLGHIKNIIVSPRPKKKNLFTLPYLEDHLLVRRSYSILSKFLNLQTFSRDSEVRQLINLIKTEPNARVLRTDIKSFFESINLESTLKDLLSSGFNNLATIRHIESFVRVEPPRDCRRLNSLRGYSHGQTNQVFTRGTGTGGTARRRTA
jgi:hypothetical protein